ncbi:hypothetical protein [Kitasatospora sp. NRRL B-11411]|uniref:hypothetical protein n=1 Tax=Kitasatospora sp. NRRL B-11411 TaxID=1463822 RepID=UPI0004C2EAA4|nr:hypothetical protein [Kitasatospora sp. NRRL B-11411]
MARNPIGRRTAPTAVAVLLLGLAACTQGSGAPDDHATAMAPTGAPAGSASPTGAPTGSAAPVAGFPAEARSQALERAAAEGWSPVEGSIASIGEHGGQVPQLFWQTASGDVCLVEAVTRLTPASTCEGPEKLAVTGPGLRHVFWSTLNADDTMTALLMASSEEAVSVSCAGRDHPLAEVARYTVGGVERRFYTVDLPEDRGGTYRAVVTRNGQRVTEDVPILFSPAKKTEC